MSIATKSAERASEIVALLRPEKPRKVPESLTAAAIAGDLERLQLLSTAGGTSRNVRRGTQALSPRRAQSESWSRCAG